MEEEDFSSDDEEEEEGGEGEQLATLKHSSVTNRETNSFPSQPPPPPIRLRRRGLRLLCSMFTHSCVALCLSIISVTFRPLHLFTFLLTESTSPIFLISSIFLALLTPLSPIQYTY